VDSTILHIVPDIGQSVLNLRDETEDVLLTQSVQEPEYLLVQLHLQVSRKGTILNMNLSKRLNAKITFAVSPMDASDLLCTIQR
jgi:hypothetical protein